MHAQITINVEKQDNRLHCNFNRLHKENFCSKFLYAFISKKLCSINLLLRAILHIYFDFILFGLIFNNDFLFKKIVYKTFISVTNFFKDQFKYLFMNTKVTLRYFCLFTEKFMEFRMNSDSSQKFEWIRIAINYLSQIDHNH